ncbi:unnamed protein product, partial [Prorocentrum cordatum]
CVVCFCARPSPPQVLGSSRRARESRRTRVPSPGSYTHPPAWGADLGLGWDMCAAETPCRCWVGRVVCAWLVAAAAAEARGRRPSAAAAPPAAQALPGQPVSVGSGSVPAAEAQELNGAAQGVRGAACGGKPVDPATGEPCEPAAAADDVWSSNEGGDTPKAVGAADVFGDVHPAVDRQLTQSAGEISALREQQADQGEGSLLQR